MNFLVPVFIFFSSFFVLQADQSAIDTSELQKDIQEAGGDPAAISRAIVKSKLKKAQNKANTGNSNGVVRIIHPDGTVSVISTDVLNSELKKLENMWNSDVAGVHLQNFIDLAKVDCSVSKDPDACRGSNQRRTTELWNKYVEDKDRFCKIADTRVGNNALQRYMQLYNLVYGTEKTIGNYISTIDM